MSKSFKKDLTGMQFGRLTVLEFVPTEKYDFSRWLCQCDCGNNKVIIGNALVNGSIKSCGCLVDEIKKKRTYKHGASKSRLYGIWHDMKQRCTLPSNPAFYNYGGRGIVVCEEWQKSFLTFQDWALSNGYQENLTLDRINANGNYEPNNCRWISIKEQQNNRRNNILIEYNGKTMTLSNLSDLSGINYQTLKQRYYKGDRDEKLVRPLYSHTKKA